MKIPSNEIHIYHSPLEKPLTEIRNSEKILSSDELEKAYRFRFETDKNTYIVCRALLRKILSKYLSTEPSRIVFSYSEKGKPFIKNSSVTFNLAHSNKYSVFAFAFEKVLGVDIEYQRDLPDALQIAKRYFSKNEVKEFKKVRNENIQSAFFSCWTRKEAFIKAVGEGLSYPLEDFSVTFNSRDDPKILWIKKNPEEIKQWSLYDIKINENFISSLAVKSNDMKIIYKEL